MVWKSFRQLPINVTDRLITTVIRYLISDGSAADDAERWLSNLANWLKRGIDMIQIREKELSARVLADLTRAVLRLPNPSAAKVLVNDRIDAALACGANGVHLRDGSIGAGHVRKIVPANFVVGVSCHDIESVHRAEAEGADLAVLGPIFAPLSKADVRPPMGLEMLARAAQSVNIPVLALGGITDGNARECMNAGAAGIAGISLFRPSAGKV